MTDVWDGVPPNGQGMWHWLRNKEKGGTTVAWFDLHIWTIMGLDFTKPVIASAWEYVAPCVEPCLYNNRIEKLESALREIISLSGGGKRPSRPRAMHDVAKYALENK